MKPRLLWKFLGINILVIAVTVFTVWMAIDYLAADYYRDLMKQYSISPNEIHEMFLEATHRSLIQATIYALILAVLLSLVLTKRVLRPISEMAKGTQKIATGDYRVRVQVSSRDEFSELAAAFSRMAETLERQEQLRKKMVTDVAHELRTPLTNIRGYLEALSTNVLPPSKDTFDILQEEVLRLVRLAESLLQLAQAEAAGITIRRESVDLPDLISQSLEMFQLKFESKNIEVTTDFPESGQLIADTEMISQVLRNLLENAWQYTSTGGKLRVRVDRLPDHIRVNFANTGAGIAEADLPLIFERFYRGEKSRSREQGGAGVGLTIVKGLVEAHGGEVGAATSPTETTIWFTLPT